MVKNKFDCHTTDTDIDFERGLNKTATLKVVKYLNFVYDGGNKKIEKIVEKLEENYKIETEKIRQEKQEKKIAQKIKMREEKRGKEEKIDGRDNNERGKHKIDERSQKVGSNKKYSEKRESSINRDSKFRAVGNSKDKGSYDAAKTNRRSLQKNGTEGKSKFKGKRTPYAERKNEIRTNYASKYERKENKTSVSKYQGKTTQTYTSKDKHNKDYNNTYKNRDEKSAQRKNNNRRLDSKSKTAFATEKHRPSNKSNIRENSKKKLFKRRSIKR